MTESHEDLAEEIDALGNTLREIEAELVKRFIVQASVEMTERGVLAFKRHGKPGVWMLMVCDPQSSSDKFVPLVNTPRRRRYEAVPLLPQLLEALRVADRGERARMQQAQDGATAFLASLLQEE